MKSYEKTYPLTAVARLICVILLAVLTSTASPFVGELYSQDSQGGSEDTQALVDFYLPRSMLFQADNYTIDVAGDEAQWSGQYLDPEPQQFLEAAAEILTIYPRSYIPESGETVMRTLADASLWEALSQIGITLMHPIAFEQAGQVVGRELLPSVDGGFDRISLEIEPEIGTDDDARSLVETAGSHGALISGDIIPLHTGLGYDFRLAEMGYLDYPGIYDMIEIPQEQWGLLPPVEDQWGFEVITNDQAQALIDEGLMPGRFDVLLGAEESVDWSGWAATGEVMGVDGQTRRWIYAHMFKAEQPALNWMDPTYASRRTQTGNIVRDVVDLGVKVNRLDAVPFLALNPLDDSDEIEYYITELAIAGTNDLAYTHRKLGGWSWVELNVPTGDYLDFMENGADLGYDFFTRAQTVHPLITGDARVLRIAHRSVLESGVDHRALIHTLQNHDEITYQLINLRSEEEVQIGDETMSGEELANSILEEMQSNVAGEAAPYNALYRPEQDGVATTYAGFIAPALGINPYEATSEQVETIKEAHVMLAHITAMQPGMFGLSQWDLVGALPLDRSQVQDRIEEGDFRWLNRGAVDLMDTAEETQTAFGLPEAQNLYGPLPQQMEDPNSFASRVADIVQARKQYRIAHATLTDVPDVEDQAVIVLVMTLPSEVGGVAVTAANYSQEQTSVTVDLSEAGQGSDGLQGTPREIVSDQEVGSLSGTQLTIPLEPLSGATIVIGASPADGNGTTTDGESPENGSGSEEPADGDSGSGTSANNGSADSESFTSLY